MFLDDIFIFKMTPNNFKNFIEFGYTVESELIEGTFHGRIHRFCVFCDADNGNVFYQTIKDHDFKNNLKDFKNFYKKIHKEERYKYYNALENGEPKINIEQVREIRYGL